MFGPVISSILSAESVIRCSKAAIVRIFLFFFIFIHSIDVFCVSEDISPRITTTFKQYFVDLSYVFLFTYKQLFAVVIIPTKQANSLNKWRMWSESVPIYISSFRWYPIEHLFYDRIQISYKYLTCLNE